MSSITVDMFEVQLGSAILLQFQLPDRVVRILSDAGVKASGYSTDHVLNKLLPILGESGNQHIDLIIGTHYDEDHLNGLVPIINTPSITIGEAWMPPVADDSASHAIDAMLSKEDLLAYQFYHEDGRQRLARYLKLKRADIETLLVLEGQKNLPPDQSLNEMRQARLDPLREKDWHERVSQVEEDEAFFRTQLDQLIDAEDCDHGTDQAVDENEVVQSAIERARRVSNLTTDFWDDDIDRINLDVQKRAMERIQREAPQMAAAQMRSFANIRKATAKDAINATALHEVTKALRARSIPMRTEIINDGEPRRYAWRSDLNRFLPSTGAGSPTLTLLGPSRGLVRKHWDRLPIEQATSVALTFSTEIKSITPSNQLSYIARLEHDGQGILITGDAGCVDFKPRRGTYYPKLLEAMLPLHVLQVAHHGGNNAHFYRVLDAANYPAQTDRSFLLLSHATLDKHRPSDEFRTFFLSTLKQGDDVQLLFTSQPRPEKVVDFKGAFCPVVGGAANQGDVRITFDGRVWRVARHAVAA